MDEFGMDFLANARGKGTSLISLSIPPNSKIATVKNMISRELGKASNIKSRVVRRAVLSALTSIKAKLKLYNKVPPNGLIIYCGNLLSHQTPSNKSSITLIQPSIPARSFFYHCDDKFHTALLKSP